MDYLSDTYWDEKVSAFYRAPTEEQDDIYERAITGSSGSVISDYADLFHKAVVRSFKGGKIYLYMLTFTKDPKKDVTDSDDKIEKYIISVLKRTDPKELWVVREGGDKEHKHIHWHVMIQTPEYLRSERFQYYRKKYGNIDISKSHTKNPKHIFDYISKQFKPTMYVNNGVFHS